jgi:beta-N-acetylhexosaminidase
MAGPGAFISGCGGLALSDAERGFFRAARPWGLILFKRNVESPAQVAALTADFRAAVQDDAAPVFVDQEGGRVQRLGPPHWRKYPAAARLGALYATDPVGAARAARLIARLMADDLAALGIDADCLPVLDVPQEGAHDVIGDRAYAREPGIVALLGRAVMQGMLEGGVLPVIKHIPGHGRARADSHLSLPVVDTPLAELRVTDFLPFAALADAPMAMTAHVVYTGLDAENPATLSAKAIGMIRQEIGFDGLLMSDDVSMKALSGPLPEITARALKAGCDAVLHCNGNMAEMEQVAGAAGVLSGPCARRAARALAMRRNPDFFERDQALAALSAILPQA